MSTIGLYVGNLPYSVSHQQLQELFRPFKPIMVAYAPGRDFAYVQLQPEEAEPAVQSMDGYQLGGHVLQVRTADLKEVQTEKQ